MPRPWQVDTGAADYYLRASGLCFPMCEREFLKEAAAFVADRFGDTTVIVNVGVDWGCSLHCFRAGAPNALIVGIDINFENRPPRGDPKAYLIRGRSQNVCLTGPAHLVFIDGSHSYKGVSGDVKNWTPRVHVGGFVLFHDYGPMPGIRNPSKMRYVPPGVVKAVNEWNQSEERALRWKKFGPAGSIIGYERLK